MEAPTPLMTAADVAAYLRMTRQGLWKLAAARSILSDPGNTLSYVATLASGRC